MTLIVVTGGGGFIGSHVAEHYAKQKENEVIIIDNLSRAKLLHKDDKNAMYNWNYLHQYKNIEFFQNDIRDFNFLKNLFNKIEIDAIIHTAGQTAVTTSVTDPKEDFENNLIGTYNILEAVRISKSNPAIVYCSTNKVFGNNVNECDIEEKETRYAFTSEYKNGISEEFSTDLCEHTPYGASKFCADVYAQEYGHIYGLKTGVFRMSCIYGTRQFGFEDQGWVAHFVISAILDRKINIYGDGKQVRDLLYVSDLIDANDKFIKNSQKLKHDVFCMGGGKENTLSLLELISILKNKLDKKINIEFFDWRPSDQKVYISDISKAKQKLNWNPKINPQEGIEKLINWTKKNKKIF